MNSPAAALSRFLSHFRIAIAACWAAGSAAAADPPSATLPGSEALLMEGDIASQLVDGVDRFLDEQLEGSLKHRAQNWRRDPRNAESYRASLEPQRERLRHILGIRDARAPFDGLFFDSTTSRSSLAGETPAVAIHAVRWPAFGDVEGEGLLLEPKSSSLLGLVVAVPDASELPEHLAGLLPSPSGPAWALQLAESGLRVVIPCVVNREDYRENLTHREFLYRSAFELGRHLIGYEVQKILAVIDWSEKSSPALPTGVAGWGDGGMLALYAAACDPRIDAALVSAYFEPREEIWREPIDRNVFSLLQSFGDAELASLVAPSPLVVEAARGPEREWPGGRGAPARLRTPVLEQVAAEFQRARALTAGLTPPPDLRLIRSGEDGSGPPLIPESLTPFFLALAPAGVLAPAPSPLPQHLRGDGFDPAERHARQVRQLDRHNQDLLLRSADVRRDFLSKLDTGSPESFAASVEPYREHFAREIIGTFDLEPLPPHPRSRLLRRNDSWTAHEVVLDLFPHVIAYGILLIPENLKDGERRPVVVCQHGLEGRPLDTIEGDHPAYHDFAARLAERGFVTFAPQNLYLFGDRFRVLQRKANPLGKTLFSIIVPQHRQIVHWLQGLPFVDPDRIAFYGLSYGGKTAMRTPPLIPEYKAVICSADFNEWVWKNASTASPYSYVWTGEYEIFEFDLGSTFNYAEMAALIAPRPFMVERGHFDGVAPDETVAYEFAKVRNLYAARLKLPGRCEIEWFDGPHTIHGEGSYRFLHRHLHWPEPEP
ncbi:MAG TPA: hypothetical protein VMN36_06480 [Verrucomicrobiales bacterium]|nr:hypothetical protein [Verrucomicrobiales bacterium]